MAVLPQRSRSQVCFARAESADQRAAANSLALEPRYVVVGSGKTHLAKAFPSEWFWHGICFGLRLVVCFAAPQTPFFDEDCAGPDSVDCGLPRYGREFFQEALDGVFSRATMY